MEKMYFKKRFGRTIAFNLFIIFIMIVLFSEIANAEKYLEFEFKISNQTEVLEHEINIVNSGAPIGHKDGAIKVNILDNSGNPVWSESYEFNFLTMTNPPTFKDYTIIRDKALFDSKMNTIELIVKDKNIFSEQFSFCNNNGICENYEKAISCEDCGSENDFCGDGICNNFESPLTCIEDCVSGVKDGICDKMNDSKCDPDCDIDSDFDCRSGKKNTIVVKEINEIAEKNDKSLQKNLDFASFFSNSILYMIVAVVIFIIVLFYLFSILKNTNSGSEELKQKLKQNLENFKQTEENQNKEDQKPEL